MPGFPINAETGDLPYILRHKLCKKTFIHYKSVFLQYRKTFGGLFIFTGKNHSGAGKG